MAWMKARQWWLIKRISAAACSAYLQGKQRLRKRNPTHVTRSIFKLSSTPTYILEEKQDSDNARYLLNTASKAQLRNTLVPLKSYRLYCRYSTTRALTVRTTITGQVRCGYGAMRRDESQMFVNTSRCVAFERSCDVCIRIAVQCQIGRGKASCSRGQTLTEPRGRRRPYGVRRTAKDPSLRRPLPQASPCARHSTHNSNKQKTYF